MMRIVVIAAAGGLYALLLAVFGLPCTNWRFWPLMIGFVLWGEYRDGLSR